MKTIGVIGGFGPEATALFYKELVNTCRTDLNTQPHVIVWHVPVSEKLEKHLLLNGTHITQFAPLLTSAAKNLEKAGADFVVLPCNTLHALTPIILKSITVRFISIVDATLAHLLKRKVTKVGILGSFLTVEQNLFAQIDHTITFINPPLDIQIRINSALHQFVTTGNGRKLRVELKIAIHEFQQIGIHDVLVACTDFHGLMEKNASVTLHDTLDILVDATKQKLI